MDMNWRGLDQPTRFRYISGLVLLAGLSCALLIFLLADNNADLEYKEGHGSIYAGEPLRTKKFVHDMELIGGKANVLIYDLTFWFEGLWQGKRLAYTIAFMTILVAGLIYYFGVSLGPYEEPEDQRTGRPPS